MNKTIGTNIRWMVGCQELEWRRREPQQESYKGTFWRDKNGLYLYCGGNCKTIHLMQRTDSLEKTLMQGRLKAGERDDRGWDGWMASPTQWTWVWVNSGSWWWTGKPGVLQSMGLQRVGHDWATALNWTEHLSNLKKKNENLKKIILIHANYISIRVLVVQSCPTLWDPMNCSLPGSSVHGTL